MAKLTDMPVTALLEAFRSTQPTPGGGSAAALAGAIGAGLLAMVAALPKPRAATEEDLERLHAAGASVTAASARLMSLVDEDAEAYGTVMSAYRLPRTTEQEKAARVSGIQSALRRATDTPRAVMQACLDAIEQAVVIAQFGNRNASSDAGVGLDLLAAGLRGARRNVEINLAGLTDAEYSAAVADEISRLEAEGAAGVAAAETRLLDEGGRSKAAGGS